MIGIKQFPLVRPLLLLLLVGCAVGGSRAGREWDLVVYGGTSAGVSAAVQGARCGRRVVLVSPARHLGGLTASGLGATDIGNKAAIGGLSREFYRRVRRHYARPEAWTWQRREAFRGRGHRPGEACAWTFEPHVAEKIFRRLLAGAGVAVRPGERLDLAAGVEMAGNRITAIRCESGAVYRGACFIDATYEGDLMALAGVSYTLGREGEETYGEKLNGVRTRLAEHHQFVVEVDPYRVPGDPSSGLLPGIQPGGPGREGAGDRRIQAYCYRICATDVPANRIPWPRPRGYDPARYELLLRNFEAGDHRIPWHPVRMPNGKTDSNNNHAFSTDHIGANYDYPDGDYAARERIRADHERYQKGLLWTLANHPRVPAKVRAHFARFGLCRDEFADNGHWPRRLYIREARRMVGPVVMTEHHCRGRRLAADSIGLAAYGMDSHNVQRYLDGEGRVRNEGDVQVHGFRPYPIAYRAITPRQEECANLLVPVCLSASHIAYGSIRMEPVFMILGQSAALAADLAQERGLAVQQVPYPALRRALLAAGQRLAWPVGEGE